MTKQSKINYTAQILTVIVLAGSLMGMSLDIRSGLHDPTEPPAGFLPAKNNEISYRSMNLNAIFIKPSDRWAVINGQIYHEGEAVGEYIITNIRTDAVELIDSTNNKEILQLVAPVKKATSIKEE